MPLFEGVNFYPASYRGKTEEAFVKHESHHGLSEEKLREIYALLVPKKAAEAEDKIASAKDKPVSK